MNECWKLGHASINCMPFENRNNKNVTEKKPKNSNQNELIAKGIQNGLLELLSVQLLKV